MIDSEERNEYLFPGASHNMYHRSMRLTFFLSGCEINLLPMKSASLLSFFMPQLVSTVMMNGPKVGVHAKLPVQSFEVI